MTQIITNPPSPVPVGLTEAIEAAGHFVSKGPDGWDVDDAAAVQAIIDGYAGSATELAYHKQQALDALAAEYAGKFVAGFNYGGKNFQVDEVSQSRVDAMSNAALGALLNGEVWNPQFYWVATDNSHMTLATAQAMRDFGIAIKNYVSYLFAVYQALRAGISNATDVATVAAIDITAGWPG